MDPLLYLVHTSPPEFSRIREEVLGSHYHAVRLDNGNIGVCATLGLITPLMYSDNIDIDSLITRFRLLSYYNAIFNPGRYTDPSVNIFTHIDYSLPGTIVMIGAMETLLNKFLRAAIPFRLFELERDPEQLMLQPGIEESLRDAGTIIVSSVAIMNGSFVSLMEKVPPKKAVFIFGPSTTLHPALFYYPQVKALYGFEFANGDQNVIKSIMEGDDITEISRYTKNLCLLRGN